MKLLPDSIKTRTILVLLVGLTVSHIGSTLVYSSDRDHALVVASEQLIAEKLATLAHLIDNTPSGLRQKVADAVTNADLAVSWGEDAGEGTLSPGDERLSPIKRALAPHFGELGPERLHVAMSGAKGVSALAAASHLLHGFPARPEMVVAVMLADGSWARFKVFLPSAVSAWSLNALLSTLVMVAATLVIAIWATRWITAPLASFAAAAERLGRDVTAPPLAEDGPREVRAAARAFNQMQARLRSFVEDRLQMLAAISHDLKTPITRLRLRTEQLPIDAAQQGRMLADLDQMARMVTSNLAFARDEANTEPAQDLDLAALLEAICDDAAEMGEDAAFDWTERLVYHGRALALRRLFSNLVENAVRYGGQARVQAARHADAIEVIVEDGGPGIPEDRLDQVFQPFFRLEGSRNQSTGGIGLGLATARTIARSHGGDVLLRNRDGGGLQAVVRLPATGQTDWTPTEGPA